MKSQQRVSKLAAWVTATHLLVCGAASAEAVRLRVDWSATLADIATPAIGQLSGSLGEFAVSAPGQEFALPADGSLGVTAQGFGGGFPNGTFPFLEYDSVIIGAGTGLKLRFDALDPTPAVSLIPVGANLAYLSTFSQTTPCVVGGGGFGYCGIVLGRNLDQVIYPGDLAAIYANTGGVGSQSRFGEVEYSFTLLPPIPVPAARGEARCLVAALLLAGAARALRSRHPY